MIGDRKDFLTATGLIILNSLLACLSGNAQELVISGTVNHYLQVDSVLPDRVRVVETAELSHFRAGDKVLMIQMTGGEVYDGPNFKTTWSYYQKTFNHAGSYEVLQVDDITESGGRKFIIFTDNLSNIYDPGEKIQLVSFVESGTVKVGGPVTAKQWDGLTGGIVAIMASDTIKFFASIDVSGMGFRGGTVPPEDYTSGCRKDLSISVLDTLYFLPSDLSRSGNKGEGLMTVKWPYTKGSGFALNGGGAGNGLYSGGAGGGNYTAGGAGGAQSSLCTDDLIQAWGGLGCRILYEGRRITMGGGGGTGVRNAAEGRTASNGGNGGGIVILITETIIGNGQSILANGQSAESATGSGGGGGAGGTVVLDVSAYSGSLNIQARGGNGGSTGASCTGSGGGGSGGVVWHSGSSLTGITTDLSAGVQGSVSGGCAAHTGSPGTEGVLLNYLLMPLNGFLFNTIRNNDTICAGQVPDLLKASRPKGGDGIYSYSWEQSSDMAIWTEASGTATLTGFQAGSLMENLYLRRIVMSDTITDTSRVAHIYVYPSIGNNLIGETDTLCFNGQAPLLTGFLPSGGNGIYNYQWQVSTDQLTWNNAGNPENANFPFDPGVLQKTSLYRRLVTSAGYCTDTSNLVTMTVLPSISGNTFVTPDTVICENRGPGLLNAAEPSGGDGIYAYKWQQRTLLSGWQDISGSALMRYNPGILQETTLYRRIVFSGNDDACIDTSGAIKTINVLPSITNNMLESDSDRYCAGDIPLEVRGLAPEGGDGAGSYQYLWQLWTDGQWEVMAGETAQHYIPAERVHADRQLRRIVKSGSFDACVDTSAAFLLSVVPAIINETGLEDQQICQHSQAQPLAAAPASGGLNGITYEWISREQGSAGWVRADGIWNQQVYTPPPLEATTLFVRKAYSDICTSISDTVTIKVYTAISNNSILGSSVQYTCEGSPRQLEGSLPENGKPGDYAYRWEQSSDQGIWTEAQGDSPARKSFHSDALSGRTYFRRIVFSSADLQECADTSNVVEVRINPLPRGDVMASDDSLCAGESLAVRFTVSGVNGPFDVTVGNGFVSATKYGVSAPADSLFINLISSQQLVMLSVADDSGCYADLTGNDGVVQATVLEVPSANAGEDDEICSNMYTLQAEKSVIGSSGWWTATGAAFDDASDENANATVTGYGLRTFTWTEANWRCTDQDEVNVIFHEQPATPDAGEDQVLDFSYATQLGAMPPPVGTGTWSFISGQGVLDDPAAADAHVSELGQSNILRWTVTNGTCDAVSDEVSIAVSPLSIPKGFTPNGDGINDVFDIGAVHAEKIKIRIFNATGTLVYESDDYMNDEPWDGKSLNGSELPEGTYYYVADIRVTGRQQEVQFRSFVEIMR